jgi:selenocysteine lyase/cysteine desulfurase
MYTDPSESGFTFDPRVEDPEELRKISRRAFFGIMGVAAAGTTLISCQPGESESVANPDAAMPTLASLPAAPGPEDEKAWETIAGQFLIRQGLTYMNTGTRGPSPRYVHMAQVHALEGIDADYKGYATNTYNKAFRTALRAKLAAFVGAKANEVALMNNTTDGMITGTFGPVLQRGDQIVYTNHDHSGGTHPILQRAGRDGLEIGVVDLADPKFHPPQSPDDLAKAFEAVITPKTRLLSFCHVNYTDGLVLPVKAICEMARARGVLTLVDGAQPPGMMKLNLHDLGCDMYAGPFHKWMMSSMYTGFFYVREDLLDRIEPLLTSAPYKGTTMYGQPATESFWKEYTGTAAQYELRGSSHYPARMAMDASLDFHTHLTPEAVEARDRYLAQKLIKGLKGIGGVKVYVSEDPRLSCALVSFTVDGVQPEALNKALWDRHTIYIRNVKHDEIAWNVNRASMHIMVTAAQVDKLLGAIEEIAKNPSSVPPVDPSTG